ncbi:MAG TPA: nicotinamide riboside transporter PnuC [Cyclobacteriaceae bacterium]
MEFFSKDNIAFTIFEYAVSYLELFGVITGIIAVSLSAFANLWSWPTGIVNVILAFFLYYQVQLYPDMFLQIFFFVTNVLGWWRWANPRKGEEDSKNELRVSWMTRRQLVFTCSAGLLGTILMALFARNLHEWLPDLFSKPSASPFLDSFIMVMSIVTTFYMIQKKIECWIIWLLVDIMATYVYYIRDIKFFSLLYLIYCVIAAFAVWNWIREFKSYSKVAA